MHPQPAVYKTAALPLSYEAMRTKCTALCLITAGLQVPPTAAEPQNPSPMVEHTREHRRLKEEKPAGQRLKLDRGVLFIPEALTKAPEAPLLVMMHGGSWIPEVAAAKNGCAVLHWHAAGDYASSFDAEGAFQEWVAEASTHAGKKWTRIDVAGWSAGCSGIRQILLHASGRDAVDRVICIDGIHASYRSGKPGPKESDIDTTRLRGIAAFARRAIAGEKELLIVHTEIFPGTFASTTETADWLLRELGVKRAAILKWGPMGSQQLSEAKSGQFELRGYAGNSAPDHVDLLHALPDLLAAERKPDSPEKPEHVPDVPLKTER